MTMQTTEPSLQILTGRSLSFNRAETRQSARIKASCTEDVEYMENLTWVKPSAHHVRHSSLDSHPSALHPINLNSKFDHLCSPNSPAKAFVKASNITDDQADKEISFFSAPHMETETRGELQEELSLEPHESLMQDAQEESFSTSMSAESKSPREHQDFILWGNAAFCLSEAKNLTSGNTRSLGLQRQSKRLPEASIKNHVQKFEQVATNTNHLEGLLSSRDEELNKSLFPSKDEGLLSPGSIDPNQHLVVSVVSTMEASMAATEESMQHQSSVGSTLSIHDFSTIRPTQAHHLEEFSTENPLMSSEAQSCCLDFDTHEMEASTASDCKLPAEEMEDMEPMPKGIIEHVKNEQELEKYAQEATKSGYLLASHLDRDGYEEGVLMAADEAKIRAELEIEIEKDLEEEIKTKIYLLNRRLEELTLLKARRHPKQEQSNTHNAEDVLLSNRGKEDHAHTAAQVIIAVPSPKLPPPSKSPENKPTLAEKMPGCVNSASNKQQLATVEMSKERGSVHPNTPLTSWRKLTTTSGWAPHTKESCSQLPSSDGSLKNTKISKNSIDGPSAMSKPKVQVENTSSFKQDCQSWTGIASSKKFDWIRTLRSDVTSTPRFSLMKTDGEESSTFLPSSRETITGNVVKTLFNEDGLSTPRNTMSKAQRRESNFTPLAGSLKRSVFSSSKTHGAHSEMVASTPRIYSATSSLRKNTLSASAKRLSQKPPSGIQASPEPMHRTPEYRQGKVATAASKPTSVSPQTSSKASRIERKGSVGAPASTKVTSLVKNGSPTHGEKLKRHDSAPPNGGAHSVVSKERKNVLEKTSGKEVSPNTKSRTAAPLTKPLNATLQVHKAAKIVPSSNLGTKRQSSAPLKASTTREKVASRH